MTPSWGVQSAETGWKVPATRKPSGLSWAQENRVCSRGLLNCSVGSVFGSVGARKIWKERGQQGVELGGETE